MRRLRTRTAVSAPAAALVAAAALAVSVSLPGAWRPVPAVALGLVTVGAVFTRQAPAVQAVLFADLLFICLAVPVFGPWPVPAVVAGGVALAAAARWPALRPAAPWLRAGRRTRELPLLMAGTLLVSAAALVAFLLITGRVPGEGYLRPVQEWPLVLLIAGGVGFALLNAAVEEFVYRGVFQGALIQCGGVPFAVVVQAAAFGLLHLGGVPGGPLGAVLAGSWGLVLGVIRVRTGGLLYAWMLHVAADVTILVTLSAMLR